ncbi:MAG: D-aspartate ligase [Acidimicrobiales bacterium]
MPPLNHDTAAPPAVLVGGADNAVAAARCLVRQGIRVVTVAEDRSPAHRVRGVLPARLGTEVTEISIDEWFASEGQKWSGAVVIPLSDPSLMFHANHYDRLKESHLPSLIKPEILKAMLDKQTTAELAEKIGIPTPKQWSLSSVADLEMFSDDVTFPVLIKPRATYELTRRTGRKFLRADTAEEMLAAVTELVDLPQGIMIMEFVPGSDALLSSYYALRQDGQTLGEFTKRVYRRHPLNEGPATIHEMIHLEATAELGRRFFEGLGLEGIGNVEFKLDERDGQLKLIECNHRITAAAELIQRSGVDLVTAVYQQARGEKPELGPPDRNAWYWYPFGDFKAARQISPGELLRWASVPMKRPALPYLRLSDPGPTVQNTANWARNFIGRRLSSESG